MKKIKVAFIVLGLGCNWILCSLAVANPLAAGSSTATVKNHPPLQGQATRASIGIPSVSLSLTQSGKPAETVNIMKIMIMLTVLTLAPAILILMTSFTRIVVVLSFLRQAIGTQQMPPNQLIVGLSLFLTFFVMAPTFKTI